MREMSGSVAGVSTTRKSQRLPREVITDINSLDGTSANFNLCSYPKYMVGTLLTGQSYARGIRWLGGRLLYSSPFELEKISGRYRMAFIQHFQDKLWIVGALIDGMNWRFVVPPEYRNMNYWQSDEFFYYYPSALIFAANCILSHFEYGKIVWL